MKGVYILKCTNNKYYVGWSSDMGKRISKHMKGEGSKWTQKHHPVSVCIKINNATKLDEQVITKSLMGVLGVDNVRGGSYTAVETSKLKYLPRGLLLKCSAKNRKGNPCRAPPIKGTSKCLFHSKK